MGVLADRERVDVLARLGPGTNSSCSVAVSTSRPPSRMTTTPAGNGAPACNPPPAIAEGRTTIDGWTHTAPSGSTTSTTPPVNPWDRGF